MTMPAPVHCCRIHHLQFAEWGCGGLMPALRGGVRRRNQGRPSVDCPCHLPHYLSSCEECLPRLAYLQRDVMTMLVGEESGDSLSLPRTTPMDRQTRAPLARCPGS